MQNPLWTTVSKFGKGRIFRKVFSKLTVNALVSFINSNFLRIIKAEIVVKMSATGRTLESQGVRAV